MLKIRIIYNDGTDDYTQINATQSVAEAYYVGKYFNVGTVYDDIKKCIRIEILKTSTRKEIS